ncbi:hypothetical protein OXYTRIMIC_556 [Oxytricha trifallax]|uniref:Uncharacterized protein n=1 Tax=Oxytricha trifallax TaxID=1172189 RepID=A0A073IC81_9SPIT|nr:hypothetical protein OXYTRIMIC_556 [Oxytricha trifallax]
MLGTILDILRQVPDTDTVGLGHPIGKQMYKVQYIQQKEQYLENIQEFSKKLQVKINFCLKFSILSFDSSKKYNCLKQHCQEALQNHLSEIFQSEITAKSQVHFLCNIIFSSNAIHAFILCVIEKMKSQNDLSKSIARMHKKALKLFLMNDKKIARKIQKSAEDFLTSLISNYTQQDEVSKRREIKSHEKLDKKESKYDLRDGRKSSDIVNQKVFWVILLNILIQMLQQQALSIIQSNRQYICYYVHLYYTLVLSNTMKPFGSDQTVNYQGVSYQHNLENQNQNSKKSNKFQVKSSIAQHGTEIWQLQQEMNSTRQESALLSQKLQRLEQENDEKQEIIKKFAQENAENKEKIRILELKVSDLTQTNIACIASLNSIVKQAQDLTTTLQTSVKEQPEDKPHHLQSQNDPNIAPNNKDKQQK